MNTLPVGPNPTSTRPTTVTTDKDKQGRNSPLREYYFTTNYKSDADKLATIQDRIAKLKARKQQKHLDIWEQHLGTLQTLSAKLKHAEELAAEHSGRDLRGEGGGIPAQPRTGQSKRASSTATGGGHRQALADLSARLAACKSELQQNIISDDEEEVEFT